MTIKVWVEDVKYYDEERGYDSFGHWDEVELDDEQVKEAVMDYLWREHFWAKAEKQYSEVRPIIESLFEDLDDRCDVTEVFAEEIAEYHGGKTV